MRPTKKAAKKKVAKALPKTAIDLVDAVRASWVSHLESDRRDRDGWKPPYVYASRVRECVRQMALDMMEPLDEPAFDANTLERFARGNEIESNFVTRLIQAGRRCEVPFQVIETQHRFEVFNRKKRLIMRGKMDGRLSMEIEGKRVKPIFEVKTGRTYEGIKDVADFDKSPWTRAALDQLLSYLLADENPWGFFIIQTSGLPTFLPVRLEDHMERAEQILTNCERAVDARHGRQGLPDMTENLSLCRTCVHNGLSCTPPTDYGDGVQIRTEQHLIEAAETISKYGWAAEKVDAAMALLKKELRGVGHAILGKMEARGKWRKGVRYDLPPEVKDQITDLKKPYAQRTDQFGFSLKISQLTD